MLAWFLLLTEMLHKSIPVKDLHKLLSLTAITQRQKLTNYKKHDLQSCTVIYFMPLY